jgi:ElaB/YqjD/DUF883 family membrane-anchored ribosome-binding protein
MERNDRTHEFHRSVNWIRQGAHGVIDNAAYAAKETTYALNRKSKLWRAKESELAERCRQFIDAQPVAAIGIAAAGGFLFSRLLSKWASS